MILLKSLKFFYQNKKKLTNFKIMYFIKNTCKVCGHVINDDPLEEVNIAITVKAGTDIDITTAVHDNGETERQCPLCDPINPPIRKFQSTRKLVSTNDFLVINLDRCRALETRRINNILMVTKWDYIQTQIGHYDNLSINTETQGNILYNVIAAIKFEPVHISARQGYNLNAGHYTAYIKRSNSWYQANDQIQTIEPNGPETPRVLLLKRI